MSKFDSVEAEAYWQQMLDGMADAEATDPVGTVFSFFRKSSYEGVVLWEDSQGFVCVEACSPHEWDEEVAAWAAIESGDI